MRNIVLLIIATSFVLSGCCEKRDSLTANQQENNNNYRKSDSINPSMYDSLAHVNVDTIRGHFKLGRIDTLVCEPVDSSTIKIYSPTNVLAPLYITEVFGIFLVEEGDLDGDGTDEIGIRTEGFMGNWRAYSVYTINKNGQWMCLIPPIVLHNTHFYETLSMGQDVVKPSRQKGYAEVHFSSWQNDDLCLIDTVMKTQPQFLDKYDNLAKD